MGPGKEGGAERKRAAGRLAAAAVWAVAFAFVEAAVVVYLRRLFYPGGFAFPLRPGAFDPILGVEVARETATVVMIAALAWMAGPRGWVRFGAFMMVFGVWDIFYYVWLWVVLGWPASPAALDVLFLVPAVWVGPVWAPSLAALCLIGWGAAVALRVAGGGEFALGPAGWAFTALGAALVVGAFLWQGRGAAGGGMPGPFPWHLFLAGLVLGQVGLVRAWRRGP